MAIAYVAIGANLGDRLATVRGAIHELEALGSVNAVSSVYETDPVGYLDQPAYLNAVAALQTELAADALMARLLEIEAVFGRERSFANAPRTLDLDLLVYDETVISTGFLTLPHPRMHERAFVLIPLAEIAPELIVPGFERSVSDLLRELGPFSGVERFADSR